MSVRESSDVSRSAAIASFTRWPGLFRLTIDVLVGPLIALIEQAAIYAGDTWACGHNLKWSLHIAGALSLIAVLLVTIDSWIIWRSIGGGVEDELGAEDTRTRFLALVGILVGSISTAVVVAEWFAVFMFGACMRA
jgi:hypothetical protein